MLDSFLVQVRVSGGLPDHTHVSVTSEPMSVTVGLGSTTIRGATGGVGERVRGGAGGGGEWALGAGGVPHSQWTSTSVLTLVLPMSLWTSQETGSVKKV